MIHAYTIRGLNRDTLAALDDAFCEIKLDSWRESTSENSDGTYDIILQDAWINISGGKVYIIGEDLRILLFTNTFTEIVIN